MKRLYDLGELEHVADILRHDISREVLDRLACDALLDLGGLNAEDFTEFYDGMALRRGGDESERYKRTAPVLNPLETAAYEVLKACRNAVHGLEADELEQDEIERLNDHLRELVIWRNSTVASRAVAKVKAIAPDAERGAKTLASARAGHAAVYGTPEAKAARKAAMVADYNAALSSGNNKTGARALVARKHGVHAKTVQRALKKS